MRERPADVGRAAAAAHAGRRLGAYDFEDAGDEEEDGQEKQRNCNYNPAEELPAGGAGRQSDDGEHDAEGDEAREAAVDEDDLLEDGGGLAHFAVVRWQEVLRVSDVSARCSTAVHALKKLGPEAP